jgi:hypothetical protein
MKSLILQLTIAAAALTAGAGAASAQQAMKAEVPFNFRAGRAALKPGPYEMQMQQTGGNTRVLLRNTDTGEGVFLNPMTFGHSATRDNRPRLEFECGSNQCVLRQIKSGGDLSYYVPGPKVTNDEPTRVTQIPLKTSAD